MRVGHIPSSLALYQRQTDAESFKLGAVSQYHLTTASDTGNAIYSGKEPLNSGPWKRMYLYWMLPFLLSVLLTKNSNNILRIIYFFYVSHLDLKAHISNSSAQPFKLYWKKHKSSQVAFSLRQLDCISSCSSPSTRCKTRYIPIHSAMPYLDQIKKIAFLNTPNIDWEWKSSAVKVELSKKNLSSVVAESKTFRFFTSCIKGSILRSYTEHWVNEGLPSHSSFSLKLNS